MLIESAPLPTPVVCRLIPERTVNHWMVELAELTGLSLEQLTVSNISMPPEGSKHDYKKQLASDEEAFRHPSRYPR